MTEILNPMLPVERETIEATKFRQYLATISASIGAICAGSALAWTSPVLPQLESENSQLHVSETEGSWVGSLLAIGALISAIPAGICAEKIGRKKTLLSLSVPFFINWLLIVFASNVYTVYIARLFVGIATGAVCVLAPMYIGEIAETSIRGTLGSFFQMFLCMGILLTYVIGAITEYITLSIILGVIPIVFAICFKFMPETPIYLMIQNNVTEAENSLKWFRGKSYDARPVLNAIQQELDAKAGKKASIKDLVSTRANKIALVTSLGLMFFQQFSGINAIIFYTAIIFKSAGSTLDPDVATIIVGVTQVLFAYVACMVIDKAGRRKFLLFSATLMAFCLGVLGFYFQKKDSGDDVSCIGWLPLASLILFIIGFSMGLGPIPWMIMGEIFSSDIREIASGIAVMTNWTLVFIVTKLFGTMKENLGSATTFFIFMGFLIAGVIFIYFIVPETKGKTTQEIQNYLNKNVTV